MTRRPPRDESGRGRYRHADLAAAPAPLQQPTVQRAGGIDHPLQQPRSAAEMRGEFAVDLERPPIGVLPLAEAAGEFTLLLRTDREQHAIAGGADFDPVFGTDPEAVPAAHVAQPPAGELELLRGVA